MIEIDRADIQGNILDGYRFDHARHVFLELQSGYVHDVLKAFLPLVTNASRWAKQRYPKNAINLGISYAGLESLELPAHVLDSFPDAFRAGMQHRAVDLGDNLSLYDREWRPESGDVHLWVWIHAVDETELNSQEARLMAALPDGAMKRCFRRNAARLKDAGQTPIEHFGYRDDISQPDIIGSLEPTRQGGGIMRENRSWRPLATGEFVLGHVDEAGRVANACSPPALSDNGTFAVFRQLEQDVDTFEAFVAQEAARCSLKPEWLSDRMVGRQKNGSPLGEVNVSETQLNNFTFDRDEEGRVCPLGSHIRRANTRGAEGFLDSFARHRILRRGMTYGERHPAGGPKGILFVALNADLERQFEFVQRLYVNDGAAPRQGHHVDPIAGSTRTDFVIPGDENECRRTVICKNIPSFVTCRGGEYFMLPGMRALDLLAHHQLPRISTAAPPSNDGIEPGQDPEEGAAQ